MSVWCLEICGGEERRGERVPLLWMGMIGKVGTKEVVGMGDGVGEVFCGNCPNGVEVLRIDRGLKCCSVGGEGMGSL